MQVENIRPRVKDVRPEYRPRKANIRIPRSETFYVKGPSDLLEIDFNKPIAQIVVPNKKVRADLMYMYRYRLEERGMRVNIMGDTTLFKKLVGAGMPEAQAEVIVQAHVHRTAELMPLKSLKHEIEILRKDLIATLGAIIILSQIVSIVIILVLAPIVLRATS